MKEDKNLKEKIGKKNPFNVPENYFESIIPEIMNKLPEKETPEVVEISLWERVKPWVYMVAMFCGLMFSLRVIVGDHYKDSSKKPSIVSNVSAEETGSDFQDEYINTIVDNVMMDDYTLYLYLSDADREIYGK